MRGGWSAARRGRVRCAAADTHDRRPRHDAEVHDQIDLAPNGTPIWTTGGAAGQKTGTPGVTGTQGTTGGAGFGFTTGKFGNGTGSGAGFGGGAGAGFGTARLSPEMELQVLLEAMALTEQLAQGQSFATEFDALMLFLKVYTRLYRAALQQQNGFGFGMNGLGTNGFGTTGTGGAGTPPLGGTTGFGTTKPKP